MMIDTRNTSPTRLRATAGTRLLANEPLARFTAARLGGMADWLYIARDSNEELADVVMAAWQDGLPVRVLGNGANVLVSDQGMRGLVVINHVSDLKFGDWHDGRNVSASAGVSLSVLTRKCQTQGLSGLEWAVSVPGSVGGAVISNAGAHGGDMAQSVCDVVVLDADKGPQMLTREELNYGYRSSLLKARTDRRFVVLLVTMALTADDPAVIENRMEAMIARRKATQPPGASLGSVFKNPPDDFAGRLIEAAGLKGTRIGGVQISPFHGNFFVNTGGATASDYYALIRHAQQTVFQHTGIMLEMEIELMGDGFMQD